MKKSKTTAEIKTLISELTLEEKAGQTSGQNFWETKPIERKSIPSFMLTDGPHGLRKQVSSADHLGISQSVPATCFPLACLTACSFDTALMQRLGEALGEECLQENVTVLLGPGANIKRSPLCGRNFEYISEDPLLTGEMATALINGVQSKNVGTSMKHYALNNQERARLTCDSQTDERALREIYLAGFETAVKKAQPWTMMCSYNKYDGTYVSENKKLLTDILRDEWGFEGAVVTDWGACNDRVEGLKAGQDLEMPSSGGVNDICIVNAVKNGTLDETVLDTATERMLNIALTSTERPSDFQYNVEEHNSLARDMATQSAVLLKNDGILPIDKNASVALIGCFAKTPRYQGSGSSRINPTSISNAYDELLLQGVNFSYCDGYSLTTDKPDRALIDEAVDLSRGKDIVFLYIGLPDIYESEGFDRSHIRLPDSHIALIDEISIINPNIVVVLHGGSAIEMPWLSEVKGLLNMMLAGQAGGAASVDLLLGNKNPCGKLAETFPHKLADNPAYKHFGGTKSVEYRESIYVGYRYYETADKPVLFPFGFGLSYTSFEYSNLRLSSNNISDSDNLTVYVTVKNTGSVAGKEIVQAYVRAPKSSIFRADKELKAFGTVTLEPQESKELALQLDKRSFAYYNVNISDWHVESGNYEILVGASVKDIRLTASAYVQSTQPEVSVPDYRGSAPAYYNLKNEVLNISKEAFEAVYGKKVVTPQPTRKGTHTVNSTISEVQDTLIGRILSKTIASSAAKMFSNDPEAMKTMKPMIDAMIPDMPLRALAMMSGGMLNITKAEGLVDLINSNVFKGLGKLIKK